ncbi:MAG: 16S rRNA (cytosine(1402)-N(4))-methyltransferase RsmH [Bacilli bacterium]|jgi:16S rRNA (cytosine1402-N4)-methyltransferase|nr:16S rRNA (cytosine(1402)-N(4))-methyltransferase RsmH [Bacilli bacterium]
MEPYKHIPVLLNEVIDGLEIRPNGIYVDCTMGGAGHSAAILKRLSPEGHLYCFDQDDYAINRGNLTLQEIGSNYTIIKSNFLNIKEELANLNVKKVDGILYDLGVSSFQFDMGDRGFSYNKDALLDMRMDTSQYLRAYDIVNYYSIDELKKIFYMYGEEKYASNIARNIVRRRAERAIETTFDLVEIIKQSIPAFARRTGGHPAKKVFQALRIAVNDELTVFEKSLKDALSLLNEGGRISVISFHSLEDRICKQTFNNAVNVKLPKGLPIRDADIMRHYQLVNKKVIVANDQELLVNNRAHSAKLRIIAKI